MATLREIKVKAVRDALAATGWNASAAARMLGIGRTTVYRIMHDNDIVLPKELRP